MFLFTWRGATSYFTFLKSYNHTWQQLHLLPLLYSSYSTQPGSYSKGGLKTLLWNTKLYTHPFVPRHKRPNTALKINNLHFRTIWVSVLQYDSRALHTLALRAPRSSSPSVPTQLTRRRYHSNINSDSSPIRTCVSIVLEEIWTATLAPVMSDYRSGSYEDEQYDVYASGHTLSSAKRPFRPRRKEPSCDTCRERKVKV